MTNGNKWLRLTSLESYNKSFEMRLSGIGHFSLRFRIGIKKVNHTRNNNLYEN